MRITLKPNEKLFLNGAVIRSDKKVTIELLNDATFLLQNHVLQEEDTNTPLKQLYYAAQMMLINPQNNAKNGPIFSKMLMQTLETFSDKTISEGLRECAFLFREERMFEILKIIRGLFAQEAVLVSLPMQKAQ